MKSINFSSSFFRNTVLSCLLLFICLNLFSQKRTEKPLQIQLNFSGAFLKTFGQALSDPEVDEFDAEDWLWPGIDIGYHLNKTFFIGYSFQPSRTQILKEPWSLAFGARDANINVNYQSGTYHNLNLRISPFNNGFYASASLVIIPEADYRMEVKRINSELGIGQNTYPTDVEMEWNFKSASTFGFGLGYNHIFNNGLSLAFGVLVPFISAPFYENISLNAVENEIIINPQDESLAIQKLRDETFFYPIQINLRFGYNFRVK